MQHRDIPAPIEREPRRVRPPYDQPDDRLDALRGDTEVWRRAVRLDRQAALLEPLVGLPVSDLEHRYVEWLAGMDTPTVAVFGALLHRARAAGPLA